MKPVKDNLPQNNTGMINYILYDVLRPEEKKLREDRTLNLLCWEIMNDEYLGNEDPEFSKVVDC